MTNTPYHVGDLVRAYVRHPMQYTPNPGGVVAVGIFRITAVRGSRCYVDWERGARHPRGICGWDNQWFDADGDDVERVV